MGFHYPTKIAIPLIIGTDLVIDNVTTADSIRTVAYIMDEILDLNLKNLSFNTLAMTSSGEEYLVFDVEFDTGLKSLKDNEKTVWLHLTLEFI